MKEMIRDILNDTQDPEEIFNAVTDYVIDQESENGYDDLSNIEKKLFMVGKYITEVNNGGFDHYFEDTDGAYAKATEKFLDSIGEKTFSKLLDQAISVHKAVIPDDEKFELFEDLDVEFFDLYDEDYELLYEKYIDFLKSCF